MIDAAAVIAEMGRLLGGLLAFLGVYGAALAAITLLLSGMVTALSPLGKRSNFLLTVALVTALALWQSWQAGRLEENVARLVPYLIVMLAPALVAMLLSRVLGKTRRRRSAFDDLGEDRIPPRW